MLILRSWSSLPDVHRLIYAMILGAVLQYRLAQLRAIDLALKATLPTAAAAPLVLLGDLNFRCVVWGTWPQTLACTDFSQR